MQNDEKDCDLYENLCKKQKNIVQYKTENPKNEEGVNDGEIKCSPKETRWL